MKKALLIILLFSIILYVAPTTCSQFHLDGEAPILVSEKLAAKTKELCFEAFGVVYSSISKTPFLSVEYLTISAIGADIPRKDKFHKETLLPQIERVELKDYASSGYDRGHMSPSISF